VIISRGHRGFTPFARSEPVNPHASGSPHGLDDDELLTCMRNGDQGAFVTLVGRYHGPMLRLASAFVSNTAAAEEVVQDTWLGVLRGIDKFEGRSSFKTWLMRILVNRARTTGLREHRSTATDNISAAVDQSRFDQSGHWTSPPQHWIEDIDDRIWAESMGPHIWEALERLPIQQRTVVTLHDVEGLSSKEVCAVLSISEGNQRVLLHRGRSRLRQALETEYGAE
jgi:RNA polymerase sigma-70 factor (ECF subfamily)